MLSGRPNPWLKAALMLWCLGELPARWILIWFQGILYCLHTLWTVLTGNNIK
uniref:Uncharacterized protein n=1 Tax=Candidatus Kentrum sp. DK TaxID=2126562 RepID=A0A450RWY4_9GAMM|nr:MAG: hypothetical protein BECKDK2373C_GA0170839_100613 [Candidatus Kentron sp. DK]VFJ47721.1 MAG: hypothetical protein BECKDK2373B_GA0170837_101825 [Candidatus Kentron sp. DK]